MAALTLSPPRGTFLASFAGSRAHRWALACGIAGPILFNAMYLFEGSVRRGYDPVHQTVSALSLGPGGWMQMANFVVFGVLLAVFGVAGLLPGLAPGRGMTAVPFLQVATAVSLVVAGLFLMDPAAAAAPMASTFHGTVHNGASFIAFLARVGGCVVLAGRFAREPGWRPWAVYSVVTAVVLVGFLSAFGSAQAGDGPAGLFERLATIVGSVFTVTLAVRLLRRGGRVATRVQTETHGSKGT